jgi:hypothetical protein
MRVFVYYNLHKHVWSVKALEGDDKGRVIAHRTDVVLLNAKPRVSEAGRQRVIREKRKNVHAGLVGDWTDQKIVQFEGDAITYNPYKYRGFVCKDDESAYKGSAMALMRDKQVVVI